MIDYFVDADSGDDLNGGTSWGDAWASMTHLFDTVATPSPAENLHVHIKGEHTIPSGGWVVSAASQPHLWTWFLRGYDGASFIRTDTKYFSTTTSKVTVQGIEQRTNYSVGAATYPTNNNAMAFIDSSFRAREGEISYDGGVSVMCNGCDIYSNIYLYGGGHLSNCVFHESTGLYQHSEILCHQCRFLDGSRIVWGQGGSETVHYAECSFDGFLFNSSRRAAPIVLDRCLLSNVTELDSRNGLILRDCILHNTPHNAEIESGTVTLASSPFADADLNPTEEASSYMSAFQIGAMKPASTGGGSLGFTGIRGASRRLGT